MLCVNVNVTQYSNNTDYCFMPPLRSSLFTSHNVRSFCSHLKDVVIFGRSMVAWLRKQAVTMISGPFYFFSSPGTRCYLEYMRIWQRSVFSSSVFLSHHLFGCARIHWNVFTRCQNSGNSTPFGSRERKDKVIMGVEWKGQSRGVSVTITKETIYSMRESKVSVTSLRIYFWSRSQEWMPCRLPPSSKREAHVRLQPVPEPSLCLPGMPSKGRANIGWTFDGPRNPQFSASSFLRWARNPVCL